jgi:gliding motility-associated-like protein
MKKTITILTIVCSVTVYGQKEDSQWLLHEDIHINFASGSTLASHQLHHIPRSCENSIVVCDEEGSLLFYTYGESLWDKNHQVIRNGEDLGGNKSTTQGSAVVQFEDNPLKYHIFALESIGTGDGSSLYHSILDLAANNGLGEVVQKPKEVWTNLTEKMVAIPNPCGDTWILLHERDNNHFVSFYLKNEQLSTTPVISKCGANHDSQEDPSKPSSAWAGQIVKAPGNDMLAILCNDGLFELVRFDAKTGIVSNPLTIYNWESNSQGYYSGEFAMNSKFFYLGDYRYNSSQNQYLFNIVQFSLEEWNSDSIDNSKEIIGYLNKHSVFKRISDGSIYLISHEGYNSIHRIENPDLKGMSSKFQPEYLDVGEEIRSLNLPQDLIIPVKKQWFSLPSDTTICEGTELNFDLSHLDASFSWSDGNNQATRTIQSEGTYTVTATDKDGCTFSDTLNLDIYDPMKPDTQYVKIAAGESFTWLDSLYNSPGLYSRVISDQNGCDKTLFLSIDLEHQDDDSRPFIPNAFTPNNDNVNDLFQIFPKVDDRRTVTTFYIFNRWGQLIYQQSGQLAPQTILWDGKINGEDAPDGVYVFHLSMIDQNHSQKTYSGSVHLIR